MRNTKRIISIFIITAILFSSYWGFLINVPHAGDIEAHKASIKRIYDTGENAAIMVLTDIKTKTTTNIEVNIPAYSQFKTYVLENTLREENTYYFKFRGLDIEYNIEYKDDTEDPTLLLFKEEKAYLLEEKISLYEFPDKNSEAVSNVSEMTTILVEFTINDGWVYVISGNGKKGWTQLTVEESTDAYIVYNEAEYFKTITNVKPSIFFEDVFLFLNQFPDVPGIAITTLLQG